MQIAGTKILFYMCAAARKHSYTTMLGYGCIITSVDWYNLSALSKFRCSFLQNSVIQFCRCGSGVDHRDTVRLGLLAGRSDRFIVKAMGGTLLVRLDGVSFPAATPGVLSVGATNLEGSRTFYSSYGGRLDVVAPGGETMLLNRDGILTTGGMWHRGFWDGITEPDFARGSSLVVNWAMKWMGLLPDEAAYGVAA